MNNFISIKDKLPDKYPIEIFHFDHGYKFTTYGIDKNNLSPNGPWFHTNIPGISMNGTHWMPLPEGPK